MTATSVRASSRRSTTSHAAVLSAATEIVGRRGYGAATIEEIAAQAGVGKQTIYRWWPNKAALFIEVYCKLVPSDLGAEDTGSLASDLDSLLKRLSRLYVGTPAGNILSGLIAEAQTDPLLAQQLREAYVAPRRSIMQAILARAADRGEIPAPTTPDFISDLFSGAIWFRLLLGERGLSREFRKQLVKALVQSASAADYARSMER